MSHRGRSLGTNGPHGQPMLLTSRMHTLVHKWHERAAEMPHPIHMQLSWTPAINIAMSHPAGMRRIAPRGFHRKYDFALRGFLFPLPVVVSTSRSGYGVLPQSKPIPAALEQNCCCHHEASNSSLQSWGHRAMTYSKSSMWSHVDDLKRRSM